MDSVGAAEALRKALANGPAAPGAYDNKGGFDSYSQHAQQHYSMEVKGVLVGYQGHVPRARDTVGTCPLGKVPGTPVSPTGKVGIDMEKMMSGEFVRILQPEGTDFKQIYRQGGDLPQYTSETRDPQNASNKMTPQMHGQGTTPGYTGHVPRVKTHSLGATTHSMPPPDPSRASKADAWNGGARARRPPRHTRPPPSAPTPCPAVVSPRRRSPPPNDRLKDYTCTRPREPTPLSTLPPATDLAARAT